MSETIQARAGDSLEWLSPLLRAEVEQLRQAVQPDSEAARPLGPWVGTLASDDVEDMRRAIDQAFEQVDPLDWE